MTQERSEPAPGARTERRIAWLTLLFGLLAGLLVGFFRNSLWGAGLAIGAGLAWLNFRWLKRGLDVLVVAATAQAGREAPQVPLGSYFAMVFRYALLALAVYVIFEYLKIPVLSMIVGLCALGAATIAASVYEILRPVD